jgi:hypothetical protein
VERTTIAGETEDLGENLPSATLSHHKSHMPKYKDDWEGKMRNAYVQNIRMIGRGR